jgi:hypothetical protein
MEARLLVWEWMPGGTFGRPSPGGAVFVDMILCLSGDSRGTEDRLRPGASGGLRVWGLLILYIFSGLSLKNKTRAKLSLSPCHPSVSLAVSPCEFWRKTHSSQLDFPWRGGLGSDWGVQ